MKTILLVSLLATLAASADSNSPEVATYVFPTTPELAPFASFPLNNFSYSEVSGEVQVAYDLPADLVGGAPVHVVFSSPEGEAALSNPLPLTGPQGEASCTTSSAALSCTVTYKNLSLNQKQINLYLSQTVSDPQELSERLNVAMLFGGEPIGVVTYNY